MSFKTPYSDSSLEMCVVTNTWPLLNLCPLSLIQLPLPHAEIGTAMGSLPPLLFPVLVSLYSATPYLNTITVYAILYLTVIM